MPFFVRFVPRANLPVTDGNSRFFDQLNAGGSNPISADATIFDVMALDAPNNTREPWSTPQNENKIGEIRLRGQFTQSLWGDEKLFFSHSRLSDDFDVRGVFDNRLNRFDANTFGTWPNNIDNALIEASE